MKDESKDMTRDVSNDTSQNTSNAVTKKKGWIRRLLEWTADGHKKAVKSGNFCPT
mgnify:CR=1 FL=1